MNISRAEKIQNMLNDIRRIDPDIEGTAVATNEGLVIASSLNENLDEERLSAVCAAVNEAIRRTAEELDKGRPTEVLIHAPLGYIFIMQASSASLLVAVTRPTANVGLILLDMRKIAREVTPILD
ncbi:hypothetical protein GX441_10210 [bacterium]|nr:hypothetical protein [bacterium]